MVMKFIPYTPKIIFIYKLSYREHINAMINGFYSIYSLIPNLIQYLD